MSDYKPVPEVPASMQVATFLKLDEGQRKEFFVHVDELDRATTFETTPTLTDWPTDSLVVQALDEYSDAIAEGLFTEKEREYIFSHRRLR